MKRRTFDILVATTGLVPGRRADRLAAALLTWAHNYIGNEVHTQLAAQQIFFPQAGSEGCALKGAGIRRHAASTAGSS